MTNKELRLAYEIYNQKYFGNKLDVVVTFHKLPKKTFGCSTAWGKCWISIEINKKYKGQAKTVHLTLLHEMVHISLPVKVAHGRRFQQGMLRLARLGAFKGTW